MALSWMTNLFFLLKESMQCFVQHLIRLGQQKQLRMGAQHSVSISKIAALLNAVTWSLSTELKNVFTSWMRLLLNGCNRRWEISWVGTDVCKSHIIWDDLKCLYSRILSPVSTSMTWLGFFIQERVWLSQTMSLPSMSNFAGFMHWNACWSWL